MEIEQNLEAVRQKIAQAALRTGRTQEDITLVAVTKTFPPSLIKEAIEAGIRIYGENRVQEAGEKIKSLDQQGLNNMTWHMIGHLQRNKARQAVHFFDLIQSVDNLELLNLINRYAEKEEKIQKVLIQVKLSDEDRKFGLTPESINEVLEISQGYNSVTVRGLMTMPPFSQDPENSRPYYRQLKEIAHDLISKGFLLSELSMGMSNDFEVAIEEGATMVRIGTAIFGNRSCTVK
jgi:pyridoxal phosphate enzyme (YggS family)